MKRRTFLRALGIGAIAATVDPEQLLWVPGKKTIFTGATRIYTGPRLLVGMAKHDIHAGNYGSVQIFGKFMNPSIYESGPWKPTPGLYRRVQAIEPIHAGDLVYSDQVDYGDAPLWTSDPVTQFYSHPREIQILDSRGITADDFDV